MLRHVAAYLMSGRHRIHRRLFPPADILAHQTAVGEFAARLGINWAGHIPLQQNPFPLIAILGNGDRGKQRLSIRMHGILKELPGIAYFHHLSQIHY